MHKVFYISILAFLLSCSVQEKNIKNSKTTIPSIPKKNIITDKKPKITHIGNEDFYKINIADASKNNSTISWGSIVSANPKGYHITKNHFPSLGQGFRQRFLILHYTALDNEKSIRVLTQQGVSSHYLVNDLPDNEIYQLVDENKRAYHAGVSYWRNSTGLNDSSIGIEIVNTGYTTDKTGRKQFHAFPEYQFRKVASLAKDIAERYLIPPTHILAHSDIAPSRKQDPGPLFPWKRLYDEYQLGMWYDELTKQNYYPLAASEIQSSYNEIKFIVKVQETFNKFGYDIKTTGEWDKQTQKVIEAFQYHFRPSNFEGVLDAETWAILNALLIKYPR
ncbi:MAG: N-acetylmuramoyl-L-alanine amidase [Flavobacteriaceae bacterium]|nr:N-acetylmuramoyl-L-alanine amidase [Flavobacteriaceae bacterium]